MHTAAASHPVNAAELRLSRARRWPHRSVLGRAAAAAATAARPRCRLCRSGSGCCTVLLLLLPEQGHTGLEVELGLDLSGLSKVLQGG